MPSDTPRLSGILESSLYVDDLPGAVAFYAGLFGFELFFHDSRMGAFCVPGSQVLLLFQRGATLEPAPGPGGGFIPPHGGEGNLHLCFAIPFGELIAWEAHLRSRGIAVGSNRISPGRHPAEAHLRSRGIAVESRLRWARGGTSLYFRDPEGNSLELATPGLWPNA